MIKSIPKGINREHVLQALADLDASVAHDFGEATKWALVHEGRRYPPKAVVGIAAGHAFSQRLAPSDFSSGDTAGKAVGYLRDLGFRLVRIAGEASAAPATGRGAASNILVLGIPEADENTARAVTKGRLLVISCGEAKRHDLARLPAIDRYKGPKFAVLRGYLMERPDRDLVIYILSAKFGLIAAETPIPDYDQKMTPARAAELRDATVRKLRSLMESLQPRELFVYAAVEYLAALQPLATFGRRLQLAEGNQGRKLAHLKRWLRG